MWFSAYTKSKIKCSTGIQQVQEVDILFWPKNTVCSKILASTWNYGVCFLCTLKKVIWICFVWHPLQAELLQRRCSPKMLIYKTSSLQNVKSMCNLSNFCQKKVKRGKTSTLKAFDVVIFLTMRPAEYCEDVVIFLTMRPAEYCEDKFCKICLLFVYLQDCY